MARIILVALGLFVFSAGAVQAQEPAAQSETERVVAAFMAALDNHNVSRAAELVAEDAQVLTPSPVTGREAITTWLSRHFSSDAYVEVSPYAATGQRVTWMTRLSAPSNNWGSWAPRYSLTWDEAVVVKGQITLWSSRGLSDAMSVSPQFKRARLLEPSVAVVPPRGEASLFAGLPLYLLSGSLALALLAGIGYGIWEARRPPRQQLHGGVLLRTLHERLAAQR